MLAAAPNLAFAALAAVLIQGGSSLAWVFSTTLLQFQTDDRYRGPSSPPIPLRRGGHVAHHLGVRPADRWRHFRAATGSRHRLLALLPAAAWAFGLRLFTPDRRTG